VNVSAETETRAAHRVGLGGDWELWPDFAVRSTGFGIAGLEVFGAPDEEGRLARVARDPRFREAVAWQSREALRGAVHKLAAGGESPSRRRRRADVVAGYWQRYCAKNDTIGFFGPLGWGRFAEEGAAIDVRPGALQAERVVHLETWAVEAVARAVGDDALLPMGPFPERDLRARLDGNADALATLDRLECAHAAVAAASPAGLPLALDELDGVFEELTGRPAVRGEGDSGGGRTVAYLDCMRDLDLTLGPGVLDELRLTLPAILEASRWWCGRVFARAADALARGAAGRDGPIGPLLVELMTSAWDLHGQMADDQRELQRRWASVVRGDLAGVGERAAATFADHEPAWRWSAYHSVDIQIAAADADAVRRGDFLIVLGDLHVGGNPLAQGLFAHRHPRPGSIAARIMAELGRRVELLPPRRGPVDMTARMFPVYGEGDVLVLSGNEPTPPGTRAVQIADVVLAGDEVTDRANTFRLQLAELLFFPIFVSAVRSFDAVGAHTPGRMTIGRTVIRRAHWTAPANELAAAGDDLADWARRRCLPRRFFARSPLERKPMLVDLASPALRRVLRRWSATTAERAPGARMELTEMLPGPHECWLEDETGHHTSELRLVAVDLTRLCDR
jgi:Lantibiotic dehydratase, N terminus